VAQTTFTLGGKRGRLVGVAKGAGMIHPNMATMLAFVMTDANVPAAALQKALKTAVDGSFNAISVDGDTSTNDCVLVMASGKLGNASNTNLDDFQRALDAVCRDLAWMIVRDGEGATRVMEIDVTGGRTDADAKLAAHAIATSPLVKTALHGGDPNWGRILAAVGRSGARFSVKRISLSAGPVVLVSAGQPVAYREKDAAKVFSRERVPLKVDLGAGDGRAVVLSSDLGHDYVSLNADYRS
jgi:glutamate N-acetyltransferase/amino-acid N-acetyltransferase